MGNTCVHPNQSNSKPAKLVDVTGHVRRVDVPITAAELMLDHPGNFVCSADEIRRTRRVMAMRADEELMAGKLYMLVKTERVNCVVTDMEMEMTILDGAGRRKNSLRRGSCQVTQQGDEAKIEGEKGEDIGFFGHKIVKCRQWKPVLEPIFES